MNQLKAMQQRIVAFRDARNWKQFHNPKDQALSLVLEASELLEHFQWRNGAELERYVEAQREALAAELSDVMYWVLLLAHDLEIDLGAAFDRKMQHNAEKYPVEQFYGSARKYDEREG